jgi:pimeloyl-ACP methyl ester carboxylesterase
MPGITTLRLVRHLSVGFLAVFVAGQDAGSTATFVITLAGVRVGTESVTISRPGGAFKITTTSQIGPPVDLVTSKFELTYSADWQPQTFVMEGALRNETLNIGTSFGVTTATNDVVQGQRRGGTTHQVSPRTIVLPVNSFGAYEALAARLGGLQAGARMPVYIAPEGEVTATINHVTPRRISAGGSMSDLQEYDMTLARPGVPMSVQVLVDRAGRLARVVYRDVALAAIREEFATVMAREVRVSRPGDEEAYVPGSGFNIGATISRPPNLPGRLPAVVLVGGSGRQDRDEILYGVPVFGYLSGALADAGFIVVRYDKRGVGQSGGRVEHAGLPEYADDLVGLIAWLRKRKDVDPDRIFVLTHGEGSAVGMTAAAKDKRIRGLGLLAAPGLTGREVVLEQQRQALERRNESEADRQAKIALQKRVIEAVTTGKGWETLPPDVRRQADSLWFKSWLLFDPAVAMKKIGQPVLVLHGALDLQTPPVNGERLATLATTQRKVAPSFTSRVVIPGVNHLLVTGPGELDGIDAPPAAALSPDALTAIVTWLKTWLK